MPKIEGEEDTFLYKKAMVTTSCLYLFMLATAMILFGVGQIFKVTNLSAQAVNVGVTLEDDIEWQRSNRHLRGLLDMESVGDKAKKNEIESIREEMALENENSRIMSVVSAHVETKHLEEMVKNAEELDHTYDDGHELDVQRNLLEDGSLWDDLPEKEIMVLQRIVEAEAGGEDADGKLLVANVVLNRVRDEAFPNTITEVVFQQSKGVTQFSPVANGRYDAVTVSEESKEAVERALNGEDLSEGALYFAARKYANPNNMRWFDENLTMLFQHGGHEFFK